MLGNQDRFEPVDEALERRKMLRIRLGRASQRHADAMQRNVAGAPELLEHGQSRPASDHVVLGVNFKPKSRRRRGEGRLKMLGLEPDSGGGSHGVTARSV